MAISNQTFNFAGTAVQDIFAAMGDEAEAAPGRAVRGELSVF